MKGFMNAKSAPMSALSQLLQRLNDEPACLVRVVRTQGSVPREVGAWMAVWPESVLGTIGGGHLELVATLAAIIGSAIAAARNLITFFALPVMVIEDVGLKDSLPPSIISPPPATRAPSSIRRRRRKPF
jgi:xanthine/CO dehydrogenase XdhC/CoxF family maturation factor